MISFRGPFSRFRIEPFPLTSNLNRIPIVAPYWADLNYQADNSGTVYRITNDDDVLVETVNAMAVVNPEFASFSPSEVLIVTWINPVVSGDETNGFVNFVSLFKS